MWNPTPPGSPPAVDRPRSATRSPPPPETRREARPPGHALPERRQRRRLAPLDFRRMPEWSDLRVDLRDLGLDCVARGGKTGPLAVRGRLPPPLPPRDGDSGDHDEGGQPEEAPGPPGRFPDLPGEKIDGLLHPAASRSARPIATKY